MSNTQIYYVEIKRQFEMTFLTYTYHVYFNSKSAMLDFKKKLLEKGSNLVTIVSYGKADFNEMGILVP